MPKPAPPREHNFVAGARLAVDRDNETVVDPWSEEPVVRVDLANAADLEAALAAAVAAGPELSATPSHVRRDRLQAVGDALLSRVDELAEAITAQMGKPITFAKGEVKRAASTFRIAAEEATRRGGRSMPLDVTAAGEGRRAWIERFPQGLVAGIAPFNFPLNLVAHKVAPALAVGCPVVLKPAPQAPGLALTLAEIVQEAGFPAGAFSALHMPIELAERLVVDKRVRHVSFTGSAKVGWGIRSRCTVQDVTLELGGNAGVIVHEDADLVRAIQRCAFGSFAAAGQVCIKAQRIFVHANVYDEFLEGFLAASEGAPGPDPRDPASIFGPMVDRAAAERVMRWVREAVDAGATLLCGGRREGNVVYPTVLSHAGPGMKVYDEEVFGPVTVIEPYTEFEDALGKVNASPYGLQAGVFTRDFQRAMQAFQTLVVGGVVLDDVPTFRVDNFPYGGVKASGVGREGVRSAMDAFTEERVLVAPWPTA